MLSHSAVKNNFIYDGDRGGVFCAGHWLAPWPSVSLRRRVLLDCVKQILPFDARSKFIEIGFGTGIFSYEFYRMGYLCTGYDLNPHAVEIANDIFNQKGRIIDFRSYLTEKDKGFYDCLAAFEVLEHNEDDAAAIKEWRELLKLGGYMIVSVPAHMKSWQNVDVRGGHIRRYEKEGLSALLIENGFEIIKFVNWGFPLMNMTRFIRNTLIHGPVYKRAPRLSLGERTEKSGIERLREYHFKWLVPFRLLNFIGKIQRAFYDYDLGDGYLVVAKRVV